MGGAASEVADATTRRRRRVGDLRPGQHPPDGLPLRPPLRGEPPVREGPGVPARAARRRPDGPARRRVGRRHGRARRVDTDPVEPRAGPRRVPAGPRQPPPRAPTSAPTSSARCSPGSGSRPTPRRAGHAVAVAAGHAAARASTPGGDERRRRDRPDVAPRPRRSRPTSPRRSPASAATSSCRRACPHTPMPEFRPSRSRLRDAIRETLAGAGLTEVVTYALVVAAAASSASRLADDGALDGRARAARGRAARSPSRTRSRASTRCCARLVGSLLEVVSTNLRHGRDDVAIFEIGKGYGAPATADPRVVAPRVRADRRGEPPAWNRPARPYDLDDAKGVIELVAGASASGARRITPLDRRPDLHPGRAARVDRGRRRPRRPASASSIRDVVERSTSAPSASSSPSSRSRASPAASRPTSGVAAPSRHPAGRARPRGRRPGRAPGRPTSRRRSGGTAGRCCATCACSTSTADAARRGEKSLAYRLTLARRDRTLTEAEVDAAVAAVVAGLAADARGAPPDLTGPRDRTGPTDRIRSGSVRTDALRLPDGRCYPCAAPAPLEPRSRRETAWIWGFLDGIDTVDLLIVLLLRGVLRPRLRPGHDPAPARHRSILFSFLFAAATSPSRSATSSPRTGRSSRPSTAHDRVR